MSSVIDNIIQIFSPSTALARVRNKRALEVYESAGKRGYNAAGHGIRNNGWIGQGYSANTEIDIAGSALRQRSRELVRNNPYYAKGISVLVSNIVGTGIQPSIHIEGRARAQKDTRAMWRKWAESTDADFDGRKTLYAIQALAARSMFESGECFIRRWIEMRAGRAVLQLQVLESDFLDTSRSSNIGATGENYVHNGIEYDKKGRKIAYYLWRQHPGENIRYQDITSVRIPADEIIHLYMEDRPGQSRGVPKGTASMNRFKDFDEYEHSKLIREKVAACFAVFVTSDDSGYNNAGMSSGDPYDLEMIEPGMIERLRPGEQVSFASPNPNDGYADYAAQILRGGAAGMHVTFEGMTGDYSKVNFSSARMGWIEFGRWAEQLQYNLLIPVLCEKIFQWWVALERLNGSISGRVDPVATWTAPRREFVDPLKEAKALSEMVRNGFLSHQEAVRQLGYDPEETIAQLKEDAEAFDAAGLKPTSDPRFDTNRVSVEEPEEAEPPDE